MAEIGRVIRAGRRWKGGSRVEPPFYELSEEDRWLDGTLERVARKMGDWLVESRVTHRRIATLELWELKALALAAIVEYGDARCERYDAEEAAAQNPQDPRSLDLLGI